MAQLWTPHAVAIQTPTSSARQLTRQKRDVETRDVMRVALVTATSPRHHWRHSLTANTLTTGNSDSVVTLHVHVIFDFILFALQYVISACNWWTCNTIARNTIGDS